MDEHRPLQSRGAGNFFLNALSEPARSRLVRASEHCDMPLCTPLFESGEEPRFAYFLTSGIVSFVFTSQRGNSIELATLGREAVAGSIFLLGNCEPIGRAEMQLAGTALRIPMKELQRQFDEDPEIHSRILDFIQMQLNLAYQITACNRLHRAQARFARWMLMVQDRAELDALPMTQEFLADMLGTRRTTVAEVAGKLQRAGCIKYKRGVVTIVNRKLLEQHTCECYGLLRDRYDKLYTDPYPPSHRPAPRPRS